MNDMHEQIQSMMADVLESQGAAIVSKEELADLREDRERLEWLFGKTIVSLGRDKKTDMELWRNMAGQLCAAYDYRMAVDVTWREAIDKARSTK